MYPSTNDPEMAQLDDLNSEGCEADHDRVKTGLKSAENSAFSRCERSVWRSILKISNVKIEYLRIFFVTIS